MNHNKSGLIFKVFHLVIQKYALNFRISAY